MLTFLESDRIDCYLKAMADAGRLSELERQPINQERGEVFRQVGYRNRDDRFDQAMGDEFAAVTRQVNGLRRRKLAELRPELAGELDRQIAEKKYHPLPPLPARLARPGAALREYRALMAFVEAKRDSGQVSHREAQEAYGPAIELFNQEGVDDGELSLRTDRTLLAHAARLIREKLLETHPELEAEMRELGRGRGR